MNNLSCLIWPKDSQVLSRIKNKAVFGGFFTAVISGSGVSKENKLAKIDNVTFFLSQYMLELGLLDSKMSQFPQSLQAVAAIYTAKKYM